MEPKQPPILMDCTIRDGNYAVDFKFTESDTGLITARLAQLGLNWIEVGHGLGLGAMEAGKGDMPAGDEQMIRAARRQAGKARVGAFFIPAIGSKEHLSRAREAGLDFIRLGSDVETLESTFPYVEYARGLGLTVCVNMMKTYSVSPKDFARRARQAGEVGAQVVYCVDSAGCMTPQEVASYFAAAAGETDCALGFHGHNNLMLAVANCLAAYQHGATFLDTTLCGLGRSAGNAPTEIVVAVLHKLGIETGIDLFSLLDFTHDYVWPLVCRQRAHDMLAVTIGYSSFHSSFLAQVADSAERHDVELRRLVAEVAAHSLTSIDPAQVEAAACRLPRRHSPAQATSGTLSAFAAPSLGPEKISTSLEAVQALLDGMLVSAAKQPNLRCVLHLVAHRQPQGGLAVPEFLLQERDILLGRITYGGFETLAKLLQLSRAGPFFYLVEESPGWAAGALPEVSRYVGSRRCATVQSPQQRSRFLNEALSLAGQRFGNQAMLVYGADGALVSALEVSGFARIYYWGCPPGALPVGGVRLSTDEDWSLLGLRFNLVLCASRPGPPEIKTMLRALTNDGKIVSLSAMVHEGLAGVAGERAIFVDLNRVYPGLVEQLLALEDMLDPAQASVA